MKIIPLSHHMNAPNYYETPANSNKALVCSIAAMMTKGDRQVSPPRIDDKVAADTEL